MEERDPPQSATVQGTLTISGKIEWAFFNASVTDVEITITNDATNEVFRDVRAAWTPIGGTSGLYLYQVDLDPGTYTLEVTAINTDGQGNVTPLGSPPGYPLTMTKN